MNKKLLAPILLASCFAWFSGCSTPPTTDQPTASASPSGKAASGDRSSSTDRDPQGELTFCKSNLKNLGTAMEMYSTDWSGSYPADVAILAPNYLKVIPDCPVAGTAYDFHTGPDAATNDGHYKDYYFFQCKGGNHAEAGMPGDFPAYDGVQGMIEDQAALDAKIEAHKINAKSK